MSGSGFSFGSNPGTSSLGSTTGASGSVGSISFGTTTKSSTLGGLGGLGLGGLGSTQSQATNSTTTNTTAPTLGSLTSSLTSTSTSTTTTVPNTQTPASQNPPITFKVLEDYINKWMSDLDSQEKDFINQATQLNALDKLMIENGEKVTSSNFKISRINRV